MSSNDIADKFRQYADADRKKQADITAERTRAAEERKEINTRHNQILHQAVLGQFDKIKPVLTEEKIKLEITYDAAFAGQLPTGIIFHLENAQPHARRKRTMDYRIKILEDTNVEVVRYYPKDHHSSLSPSAQVEDLGNKIGRATAADITPGYVDKVLDLAFKDWFGED